MTEKDSSSEVLVLTGAGASAHIGLPTLKEVMDHVKVSIAKTDILQLFLDVKRSIEARMRSGAIFEEVVAQLRTYESLGETLRTDTALARELGNIPSVAVTGHFEYRMSQMLTICYRALLEIFGPDRIQTDTKEMATVVELLTELAELNGGTVSVYTTNYDCSYQVLAAQTSELEICSHIDNQTGNFSNGWSCPQTELEAKGLPRILVNRLHGNIAWFKDEAVQYQIYEVYGAGGGLRIDDDRLLHRMSIKLTTSDQIGLNAAFLRAFEEFNEQLERARVLFVWGFSFRDREVVRAINNANTHRAGKLPIVYLDPFLSEIQAHNNILQTLRPVPVQIAPNQRLKQVPWRPQQSGRQMIDAVLQELKEYLR